MCVSNSKPPVLVKALFKKLDEKCSKSHFKMEQKKRSKAALNTHLQGIFSVKHHSAASPEAGM